MTKYLFTTILFLSVVVLTQAQSKDQGTREFTGKVKVRVDGVACPFCSYGLEKKLLEIEGVMSYEIDIDEGTVTLEIEKGKSIYQEDIKKKVVEAGFTLVSVWQAEMSP